MKVISLNLILVLLLFTSCMEFKPIAVYDIEPEYDNSQQEKVFFDESLGLLWQELKDCAELDLVNEDGNNFLRLEWNKVNCDWVGFGNSWSNFVADDISETIHNSAISFRVKSVEAEQRSIPFVIGLEDYSGGNSYVFSDFNAFANQLSITTDKWTTLYIPLSRYDYSYKGVDPTNIKQMIIQLEGAGKVFLDDIKVVTFTKDDYDQMLADVEDLRPKGNANQLIYPSNFKELAWNIGDNDCHSLIEKDKQIQWQWNSCDFYNRWGFNWNNWYAFNLRGIADKTALEIKLSSDFSPFKIVLEDYTGKSSEVVAKSYKIENMNDSVSKLNIPLSDFKLIEKDFILDQMKQFQFVGDENGGSMVIYEMKLIER
tara:strand:+ start:2182 stop:3294 length:1113 start_codon:yes stop_codon:yes gene_type:complete